MQMPGNSCLEILPLGCTPRMTREFNHTSAGDYNASGSVEHVNDLVFEYNRLLDEQIGKLNTEFSYAQMVSCDVSTIILILTMITWLDFRLF